MLRFKVGDHLILFNGDGYDYETELSQTGKQAIVKTGNRLRSDTESPLTTHLFQGISRSDRMDTTIQKSVELGVNTITPVFTQRSAVKLDPERAARKTEHWQKIAISACEQSGRGTVPVVNQPEKLDLQSLVAFTSELTLVLSPGSAQSLSGLKSDHPQIKSISLLVGPESGLTDQEINDCNEIGLIPVSLGPRILRTETAAPAALGLLQSLWGDW